MKLNCLIAEYHLKKSKQRSEEEKCEWSRILENKTDRNGHLD